MRYGHFDYEICDIARAIFRTMFSHNGVETSTALKITILSTNHGSHKHTIVVFILAGLWSSYNGAAQTCQMGHFDQCPLRTQLLGDHAVL